MIIQKIFVVFFILSTFFISTFSYAQDFLEDPDCLLVIINVVDKEKFADDDPNYFDIFLNAGKVYSLAEGSRSYQHLQLVSDIIGFADDYDIVDFATQEEVLAALKDNPDGFAFLALKAGAMPSLWRELAAKSLTALPVLDDSFEGFYVSQSIKLGGGESFVSMCSEDNEHLVMYNSFRTMVKLLEEEKASMELLLKKWRENKSDFSYLDAVTLFLREGEFSSKINKLRELNANFQREPLNNMGKFYSERFEKLISDSSAFLEKSSSQFKDISDNFCGDYTAKSAQEFSIKKVTYPDGRQFPLTEAIEKQHKEEQFPLSDKSESDQSTSIEEGAYPYGQQFPLSD